MTKTGTTETQMKWLVALGEDTPPVTRMATLEEAVSWEEKDGCTVRLYPELGQNRWPNMMHGQVGLD